VIKERTVKKRCSLGEGLTHSFHAPGPQPHFRNCAARAFEGRITQPLRVYACASLQVPVRPLRSSSPYARALQTRNQTETAAATVPSPPVARGTCGRRGDAGGIAAAALAGGNICRFRARAEHLGQGTAESPQRLRQRAAIYPDDSQTGLPYNGCCGGGGGALDCFGGWPPAAGRYGTGFEPAAPATEPAIAADMALWRVDRHAGSSPGRGNPDRPPIRAGEFVTRAVHQL
jgi:hypothetical protein